MQTWHMREGFPLLVDIDRQYHLVEMTEEEVHFSIDCIKGQLL